LVGSAFITPQLGLFQTKQLMVSGKRISADEGYRLGFVSSVADNVEQLEKATQGWIDELMENGPQVRSTSKIDEFLAPRSFSERIILLLGYGKS
jgi:enoyl-CoA hydratase/carnithine racemase